MRKALLIGLAAYLVIVVGGCGRSDDAGGTREAPAASAQSPTSGSPSPNPRPSAVAESPAWVMSAHSFGPITTDMTKEQILATGAFREPPYECDYRLDWHSQTYWEDSDGYQGTDHPRLSSITFWDGKATYIDAGPTVRTDTGIGVGDTVKQLRAAYSGHLVFYDDPTGMKGNYEAFYGISGKRSHLVFYVDRGRIEHFYLTPGAIQEDERFGAAMRGAAPCP